MCSFLSVIWERFEKRLKLYVSALLTIICPAPEKTSQKNCAALNLTYSVIVSLSVHPSLSFFTFLTYMSCWNVYVDKHQWTAKAKWKPICRHVKLGCYQQSPTPHTPLCSVRPRQVEIEREKETSAFSFLISEWHLHRPGHCVWGTTRYFWLEQRI